MPEHEAQDRAAGGVEGRAPPKNPPTPRQGGDPQAMAEYQAAIQRMRDRTSELRRQRLAREAQKQARSA